MTALAAAERVTRRFGDVLAVSEVNLTVRPGEVVGLIGANGAGKTTLIKVLLGLIRPTSGEVGLFGEPPSRRTRRRVGYVPQGLGLYADLTVADNRAFAAAAYGIANPPASRDLAAVENRLVSDLPLGLRRRTAFAIAADHDPELLVLDEPTSGVDPLGRARLWDDIHAAADRGVGVLVTTHYMSEAEQCDRLVVMVSGRVVAEGSLADVLGDATAVRIRTDRWEPAFRALRDAGFGVGLVGRSLRVVEASRHVIADVLAAADLHADLEDVPVSFEEAFLLLAGATADRTVAERASGRARL